MCGEEGVFVFAVGGREGKGGTVAKCHFSHLKIRASPGNKDKPNCHQKEQKGRASGIRNELSHVCMLETIF